MQNDVAIISSVYNVQETDLHKVKMRRKNTCQLEINSEQQQNMKTNFQRTTVETGWYNNRQCEQSDTLNE